MKITCRNFSIHSPVHFCDQHALYFIFIRGKHHGKSGQGSEEKKANPQQKGFYLKQDAFDELGFRDFHCVVQEIIFR